MLVKRERACGLELWDDLERERDIVCETAGVVVDERLYVRVGGLTDNEEDECQVEE